MFPAIRKEIEEREKLEKAIEFFTPREIYYWVSPKEHQEYREEMREVRNYFTAPHILSADSFYQRMIEIKQWKVYA